MKKASEIFKLDRIVANCKTAHKTFVRDTEGDYDIERYIGDGKEYYLFDISSGAAGTYQPQEIYEGLQLTPQDLGEEENIEDYSPLDDEWFWDGLDRLESELTDEINEYIAAHGCVGRVCFGHLEADGSYGLFYLEDLADYEDEMEEYRKEWE
jgi:hypothetical protein